MFKINTNSKLFNSIVAQLAHFAWGAFFVDISLRVGLPWFTLTPAWAAPKEFLFDTFVEDASQLDNAIDFSFYMAGMLVRRFLLVG